ncbi:methyl-accepting chemotaxis protein [Cellvibrio mixtus]|uniref:methyl-accepting chemotaxis protein n=1 Tax=Cellvibrio mixtus TaxID=39650 RepID=UPI00058740FE|nr:methyl-accepting chemotaxis protein [Cellvibrio mixtus]
MSITKKFMFALGAILLAGIFLCAVSIYFLERKSIQANANAESERISTEALHLLGVIDSVMSERVKNSMALLRELGGQIGSARQGERVKVGDRDVPDLLLGDTAIANQFTLVDKVTAIMGGTATIFSKDGADYVRISTNVMTPEGRATGTVLAPQGAAIKQIQQNKAFYGLVDILGSPYLTGYEPIHDVSGNVIGVWYVGYKADLQELFTAIEKSRVLENGFVAIRDDLGATRIHSTNMETAEVDRIINSRDPQWQLNSTRFSAWNYEIITAYSRAEISALVFASSALTSLLVLLAGLIILVIVYLLIQWVIVRPLHQTIQRLRDIVSGEGDLTQRFRSGGNDELAELANGVDDLMDRLQGTVNSIAKSTEELFLSASQLKLIATQSSQSVTRQSQDINSIASAIYEMSNAAQQVADHADNVAQAATKAQQDAERGYTNLHATIASTQALAANIEQAAKGIDALAGASNEIGAVLNVIRSIAEQTNLLALNAAIEAARAGEQGRGFAVVADEVRSLASRTQTSTEEVDKMVKRFQTNSVQAFEKMRVAEDQAHANVSAAGDSGHSIQQVLSAVSELGHLNREISASVHEQSHVAEDINNNITRINNNSDENHQRVQETLLASERVARITGEIQRQLANYKT